MTVVVGDRQIDAMTAHPPDTEDAPMRASQKRARRIRVDLAEWPIPGLVDRMLDTYLDWCETADAVAGTYGRWCAAPTGEQGMWFAAYMAALDQEEAAAAVYADSIRELGRWLHDSDSDRASEPREPLG